MVRRRRKVLTSGCMTVGGVYWPREHCENGTCKELSTRRLGTNFRGNEAVLSLSHCVGHTKPSHFASIRQPSVMTGSLAIAALGSPVARMLSEESKKVASQAVDAIIRASLP